MPKAINESAALRLGDLVAIDDVAVVMPDLTPVEVVDDLARDRCVRVGALKDALARLAACEKTILALPPGVAWREMALKRLAIARDELESLAVDVEGSELFHPQVK